MSRRKRSLSDALCCVSDVLGNTLVFVALRRDSKNVGLLVPAQSLTKIIAIDSSRPPAWQAHRTHPYAHCSAPKPGRRAPPGLASVINPCGPTTAQERTCSSTPLTACLSQTGGHHRARPKRRAPPSKTLTSNFLKTQHRGFPTLRTHDKPRTTANLKPCTPTLTCR